MTCKKALFRLFSPLCSLYICVFVILKFTGKLGLYRGEKNISWASLVRLKNHVTQLVCNGQQGRHLLRLKF